MVDFFVSYRRTTDKHPAGRLQQGLEATIPRCRIFMDVNSIPPGLDFPEFIREKVLSCKVLLAIVGPEWLNVRDVSGQLRLHREDDLVRMEIASALARRIPVVPILVDQAPMPRADELPNDLAQLTRRQAFEISHSTFDVDVQRLSKHLKNYVGLRGTLRNFASKFRTTGSPILRVPPAIEPVIKQHEKVIAFSRTPVEKFYLDRIVQVKDGSVTATQLYEEYCSWCESWNLAPATLPEFGRDFSELGVRKERIAGRVRYINIGIANN